MVYDCFTFFNELDLLEIRLNTLDAVVDKFVIAEATRTHTGKPKELLFQKNQERFKKFAEKIIYIVVDDLMPEEEVVKDSYNLPWVNENRQRNGLIRGLVETSDSDVIIVSDLDEIPRPEKVPEAVALARQGEVVRFEQEIFAYYFNFKDYRNPYWHLGSIALSWKTFCISGKLDKVRYDRYTVESECQGNVIQKIRFLKHTILLRRAGWHFTYMGGAEKIKKKIAAFSHQEALVAVGNVEKRFSDGTNILNGRRDNFAVRLEDGVFPAYIVANVQRYKDFIVEVSDAHLKTTRCMRFLVGLRGGLYRLAVILVPRFLERPLMALRQKFNFR